MNISEAYELWLEKVTAEEREELLAFSGKNLEIRERFAAPLAFGTAGMRGEIGMGTFRMNVYTVSRATLGLAKWIISLGKEAMDKGVVISYDTRRFSLEFAIAAAEVLSKAKIKAFIFENVRPVPMCSFAVRYLEATAGIMITASHNPKQYNGYKVYGSDGAQMSPESTALVVKYIDELDDYFSVPRDKLGITSIKGLSNFRINDFVTVIGNEVDEVYYDIVTSLGLSPEAVKAKGKDVKLVYTPLHGAGYIPVTTVLSRMGIQASVVEEQAQPDTEFSTVSAPNPENKDTLLLGIALGQCIGADVVIGTDPDSDRMGLAVRNFENEFILLNGNQIGALLLDYILCGLERSGKLPKNGAVVKTIVTTSLADKIAKKHGVTVFNVLTGFKFIGEKIKEWEQSGEYTFLFGYEESYGYLRGTHSRDKDAVVASMLTAEMVCYYESIGKGVYQRLMELFDEFGYYYETNKSIIYNGVDAMRDMSFVMSRMRDFYIDAIGGLPVEYFSDYSVGKTFYPNGISANILLPKSDVLYYSLADGQFICVRPSGTEPKLKIYVLCTDQSLEAAQDKGNFLLKDISTIIKNQMA